MAMAILAQSNLNL